MSDEVCHLCRSRHSVVVKYPCTGMGFDPWNDDYPGGTCEDCGLEVRALLCCNNCDRLPNCSSSRTGVPG